MGRILIRWMKQIGQSRYAKQHQWNKINMFNRINNSNCDINKQTWYTAIHYTYKQSKRIEIDS
jgi:hypothetical protein